MTHIASEPDKCPKCNTPIRGIEPPQIIYPEDQIIIYEVPPAQELFLKPCGHKIEYITLYVVHKEN